MATLSAGYVFGATETVTNAKLASLVNNATLSSVAQTDISAGNGLVYYGTSAPSDTDQLWADTSATPVILKHYNSNTSQWAPSSEFALFTNRTGQTGSAGRVLILDTSNSNSYTYTSTAGDTKFLGIETGSIANTSAAAVVGRGVATVLLEISASAGTYIRTSTATGKAEPCVNTASGIFGFLTESGTASARANIVGIDPNGTLDQTANYTWTGTHTFNGTVALTTASGTTTNWTPIVQVVVATVVSSATGSTVLPYDNTIPQNTEGDQYISAAITPKNSNNTLEIEVIAWLSHSAATALVHGALFQDNTADAIDAVPGQRVPATSELVPVFMKKTMTAGTTSQTTFKARFGSGSGGTTYFLADASGAVGKFGGKMAAKMIIREYKG